MAPVTPRRTSSVNYRDSSPALGGRFGWPAPTFRERQTTPTAGLDISGNAYPDGQALQDLSELTTEREVGTSYGATYVDPGIIDEAAAGSVADNSGAVDDT